VILAMEIFRTSGGEGAKKKRKEKCDIFLHKLKNVKNMSSKKVSRSTTARTWLIYLKCEAKMLLFSYLREMSRASIKKKH
jgi:hypothetical protein